MRITAVLLAVALTGCGVTAQDEPTPLVTSSGGPVATPTLTQRPDPPSSSPTTTTTTTTTPATTPTTSGG
ncbi:hypothetical protein ABZ816_25825 [Actinosynnema sp. NPDC047251]|uniref:hypothetical protein n=1 Tax=Saccharothrix espanaensis TaxID=103731 RepID=UPI0002FBCA6A|nr:hypothetical protein [Saccharothrix espanaensis]